MVNPFQRVTEFLRKIWSKIFPNKNNTKRYRITGKELYEALDRDLIWDKRCYHNSIFGGRNMGIYIADKDYYAVDITTAKKWSQEITHEIKLKLNEILKKTGITWLAEIFDCDNWATRFKSEYDMKFLEAYPEKKTGAVCGECWYWYIENNILKYGHAVNFIYDPEEGKIRLKEPQTGLFINNLNCVFYFAKV